MASSKPLPPLAFLTLLGCASRAPPPPRATRAAPPPTCVPIQTGDGILRRSGEIGTKWGDSFLPPYAVGRPLPPSEQWVLPCASVAPPPDPAVLARELKQLRCYVAEQDACVDGGTDSIACTMSSMERCGMTPLTDAGLSADAR